MRGVLLQRSRKPSAWRVVGLGTDVQATLTLPTMVTWVKVRATILKGCDFSTTSPDLALAMIS